MRRSLHHVKDKDVLSNTPERFTLLFASQLTGHIVSFYHVIVLNSNTPKLSVSLTEECACTRTLKRVMLCSTLEVQHISLMECMESCGAPISSTGIPRRAARMGPMVVPHGLSLRTITSCRGQINVP